MDFARIKKYDEYRIYRKGCGVVLSRIPLLSKLIIKVLYVKSKKEYREIRNALFENLVIFTDIDGWIFHDIFNDGKLIELYERIVEFNIPKQKKDTNGNYRGDSLGIIVDFLANEYGWTKDYIYNDITLFEYIDLSKAIKRRHAMEIRYNTIIANNPKQAFKIAKEFEGWHEHDNEMSVLNAIKRKRGNQ